ncbi:MAG: ABC transporter ATP-binding protein [Flavobacteriaceae bacterium]|nr:ABC transporter ATP-binding protein [Flavobacteriaceae bacterium]NVK83416.1 ABC transporter ATP-binding protein [Cytophagia bacterium]
MSNKVVLKVENVSKQYRLGLVGTRTLSHDINRWWAFLRGKEDPYLKIGETNDRALKRSSDYVWSLRGINFDVAQGEVIGIIGKNGAGKSTLLKILSRVTGPTTGRVMANGRIGALLEVGTGFHPELTGRENIFLNGAILGMKKLEIALKLDEIIDFSGCERYIDTPVKRYSSGMKVRLAFAVAAFLEPEILIVDEVLAVGDAEFQKKAIGKMQDVSRGEGRTVLFVSHNMSAIKELCTRSILLENGMVSNIGFTGDIVNEYLLNNRLSFSFRKLNDTSIPLSITEIMLDEGDLRQFDINRELRVYLNYAVNEYDNRSGIVIRLNKDEVCVYSSFYHPSNNSTFDKAPGMYSRVINLNPGFLKEGNYSLSFYVSIPRMSPFEVLESIVSFNLVIPFDQSSVSSFSSTRIGTVGYDVLFEVRK